MAVRGEGGVGHVSERIGTRCPWSMASRGEGGSGTPSAGMAVRGEGGVGHVSERIGRCVSERAETTTHASTASAADVIG